MATGDRQSLERLQSHDAASDIENCKPACPEADHQNWEADNSMEVGRRATGSEQSTTVPNSRICAAEAGPSDDLPTRPRLVGAVAFETPKEDHHAPDAKSNIPMTVKDAARFLGVSPQTVYLWVERRQIPHLRVMGRNIRFLRSELEPFRAQFKQEVENGTAEKV